MVQTCKIRHDLISSGFGVPVGEIYYFDSDPIPYRWIKNNFQVLIMGKWLDAYSIDFEF